MITATIPNFAPGDAINRIANDSLAAERQKAADRIAQRVEAVRKKAEPAYHRLVHQFANGENVIEALHKAAEKAGKSDSDIAMAVSTIERRKFLEEKMEKHYGPDWRAKRNTVDRRLQITTQLNEAKDHVQELERQLREEGNKVHWHTIYTLELDRMSNDPLFANVGE